MSLTRMYRVTANGKELPYDIEETGAGFVVWGFCSCEGKDSECSRCEGSGNIVEEVLGLPSDNPDGLKDFFEPRGYPPPYAIRRVQ